MLIPKNNYWCTLSAEKKKRIYSPKFNHNSISFIKVRGPALLLHCYPCIVFHLYVWSLFVISFTLTSKLRFFVASDPYLKFFILFNVNKKIEWNNKHVRGNS